MSEQMENGSCCGAACGGWKNRALMAIVFIAALAIGGGLLSSGVFAGEDQAGATCSVDKAKAASSEGEAKSGCCPSKAKAASSEEEAKAGCCPSKAKAASSEEEAKAGCADKAKAACCSDKEKAGCCPDKAKAASSEEEAKCPKTGKSGTCSREKSACASQSKTTPQSSANQ